MTAVLDILALVVGLVSGYVAAGPIFDASYAGYYGSLFDLLNTVDLWGSVVKCAIYGLIIGVVCCYVGLNAKGGPIGVGRRSTRPSSSPSPASGSSTSCSR